MTCYGYQLTVAQSGNVVVVAGKQVVAISRSFDDVVFVVAVVVVGAVDCTCCVEIDVHQDLAYQQDHQVMVD